MDGLRHRADPSSHFLWRDEPSSAITESDGRARLWYPPTVAGDTTGFVSFSVKHPDFVTLRETSFDVSEGGGTVTLERGSFLVVSGYLPSGETVDGIVPKVSDEARLRASDWTPMGEGRLATSRIPVGTHALWISYRSPSGETYHSEVTPFTLVGGEQHELAVALQPGLTLTGRLAESVPRPVTNGAVIVNLSLGFKGRPAMMRPFNATVEADGTFVLRGLPPGTGEIIGLCDGWVSTKVKPLVADHDEDGGPPADELELQLVELPMEGEYVLAMEPTATLAVSVENPEGRPLPGATVHLWPNVQWRNGYSQMFFERSFQATSGSGGLAVVEGLIPGEQPFAVFHEDYEMDIGGPRPGIISDQQKVDLPPGERVERTVRMRKKAND